MKLFHKTVSQTFETSYTHPHPKVSLTLHLVNISLSLTSIILFATAIPKWNANFFHNSGPMRGDWTDGMPLGPLTFSFLFSLANIVNILIFYKRKWFSPKIAIFLNCVLLLTLGPSLAVAANGALFRHWQPPAQRTQSGEVVCNLLNIFSRECQPVIYTVGELQLTGIVVGGLSWFVTFLIVLLAFRYFKLERQQLKNQHDSRMKKMLLQSSTSGWYGDLEKGTEHNDIQSARHERRRHRRHRHQRRKYGDVRGNNVSERKLKSKQNSSTSSNSSLGSSVGGTSSVYSRDDSDLVPIYPVSKPRTSYWRHSRDLFLHRR